MNIQTEETLLTHLKNWGQVNTDKLSTLTKKQEVSLQTGLLSTLKEEEYFEWSSTDNIINDIYTFIYDSGLIVQFDWPGWKEKKQILNDIKAGANVSTVDLVKTLTSIIRADRFSEGTFLKATVDGTIFSIFKKLSDRLMVSS